MFVTDQEMQNVALHVRRLRKIHKLTQKQRAKMLAISPGSLPKIEKGILPPKHRVLVPFRISNIFGVPVQTLFSQKPTDE